MEAVKRYGNFIDGKWAPPHTGNYYKKVNPADYEDVIGEFPLSSAEDAVLAIDAAHTAFRTWGKTLPGEREKYLLAFIAALERRTDEIALALVRELGKTLGEAKGEPLRGIVESRYNTSEIFHMDGVALPSDRAGVTSVANRVPLGVISAISPWNFPFMTPVRKIIPALAAGNTVVFKPASETPHSAVLLMELFEEAGFPPGVVNLVIGSGGAIGDIISGHAFVRGVTFTGSTDVGLRINELCARNLAKTQLEMGGKNPGIVAEYGDLPLAANTVADAAMQLAGQRCTSISRVIVLEDQADEFEELLVKRLQSYKVGNGLDPDVMYGPVINAAAGEKILGYIQGAVKEGAAIKCGGRRVTGGAYDKGFFIEPTLITHVAPQMRIAIDEVFGPVLAVIRVRTFEEAMKAANDTKYGLSSCLFSDNDQYKFIYMRDIESGMAHINHGTVTDGCMPFAGVKNSGIGAPSKGSTNKDFFTQWKMVYVNYL